MPKRGSNMDNKSDEQFIITQDTIESNRQESDDKITKLTEDLKSIIKSTITSIMDRINISKYLPGKNNSPKPLQHTTVVPANVNFTTVSSRHYTKNGGM